jgi:hypothetical protein
MRPTFVRSVIYAAFGLLLLIAPSASATQAIATPAAGTQQTTLAGNGFDLLPKADTEGVAILAVGERSGSFIPVIVQNNTDEVVHDVHVKVDARDAAEKLIGVGETLSSHAMKPTVLDPGDISLGFISLDSDIPLDADLKYSVTSESGESTFSSYEVDVEFGEVNWLGDRIVGEIINPSDEPMSVAYLMATCISPDGVPLLSDVATIDDSIAAGGSTTFQLDGVFGDLALCENFLIAGSGR